MNAGIAIEAPANDGREPQVRSSEFVLPLVEILKKDIARLKTHRQMWARTENPLVLPSDGQCEILINDLEKVVAGLERQNDRTEPRNPKTP